MVERLVAPDFETVEVAVDGERGSLWLNRPEKLNPIASDGP